MGVNCVDLIYRLKINIVLCRNTFEPIWVLGGCGGWGGWGGGGGVEIEKHLCSLAATLPSSVDGQHWFPSIS